MTMDAPYTALCPIILASGSPRRRDFLTELGLDFTILLPDDAVEPKPEQGEAPVNYVCRAAKAKAMAVEALISHDEASSKSLVLAADTVVALHGEIMGKPQSDDDAFAMLSRLVGQTHEVISACCVYLPSGAMHTFFASTKVHMWDVPHDALAAYVATGEPKDKAGAYGIQGIGAFLVRGIEGSWTNVVGLPVAELVGFLNKEGLLLAKT